jgi:hypothetical protein
MVTAIMGMPKRVASKPLRSPAARPVPRPAATRMPVPAPAEDSAPMTREASAMIPATEMSMSPMMIPSVMGRAMRAFSTKLKVVSRRFAGLWK